MMHGSIYNICWTMDTTVFLNILYFLSIFVHMLHGGDLNYTVDTARTWFIDITVQNFQ
jgi:hypothetical protein